MREYEVVVILRNDLEEDDQKALLDRIVGWMSSGQEDAAASTVTHWGERKLAYEIKDQNTGHYVLLEGMMDAQNVREVERNLLFVETVLRHLVIRKEPLKAHEVDYKDASRLKEFTTEHGHIIPRRRNRVSAKQQRSLSQAVKRARHLAMLPFKVD